MSAYLHTRLPPGARTPGHTRARGAPAARHILTLTLALLTAALLLSRPAGSATVVLSVNTAPPPIPVYEQPPLPAPGYMWIPGYWSYGPDGYYWVPATWVLPPDPDLLWTPGYWDFSNGLYVWNPGYWAPAVGFYGGINYGYGYFGHGYQGGYWRDQKFYYNRAVTNVSNTNVTNVYNTRVTNNVTNNVSYHGGPGGLDARPSSEEQAAAHQPRHAPSSEQNAHAAAARGQHELVASVNQGRPAIAATPKPNTFSGPGVVAARGAGSRAEAGHAAPPSAARQPPTRTQASPNGAARPEEPPRRLAQAPPQTAPPPTHERPGPAERATPPPESRASPEVSPNARPQTERPQAERTPPPAAGPAESRPSRAQPQHEQRQEPAREEQSHHPQRSEDHPPQ